MNLRRLLFENTSIKQTVLKNTFWLSVAEAITQILKLVLIVYMARILGVQEYGKFSFALSFVAVAVIFSELGLPDIITRELSQKKESEQEYASIVSLKIILSVISVVFMGGFSFFITTDPMIRLSIWLLLLFIVITSFLNIVYGFFRARQHMQYEAVSKIIQYSILIATSFAVLLFSPSILHLSLAYLFANGLALFFTLVFFHRFVNHLSLAWDTNVWKKYLGSSWPLTLGLVVGWIYVSVSSVILGYFGYNLQNGWYGAASTITGGIVISAILVSRSFFPVLSKATQESKDRFQKIWNYQKEAVIIIAIPMMIGAIALAPAIIQFFYGISYGPAVFAFRCLALVSGIDFLYYPYVVVLIIFHRQKMNFLFICIGLIVNIVLSIALIPEYNLNGVAIANLISSAIVLFLAMIATIRYTSISPFNFQIGKTTMLSLVSGIGMFAIISMPIIRNINVIALVMLGMTAYVIFYTSFYYGIKYIWK